MAKTGNVPKEALSEISFSVSELITLILVIILSIFVGCVLFYEKPPITTGTSLIIAVVTADFAVIRSIRVNKIKAKHEKEKEELKKEIKDLKTVGDISWDSVKYAIKGFPKLLKDNHKDFESDFILCVNAKGAIIAEMICDIYKIVPIYVGTMIFKNEAADKEFTEETFNIKNRIEKWFVRPKSTLKFFKTTRWYVSIPEHILELSAELANTLKVLVVHDFSLSGSVMEETINRLKMIGFKKENIVNYCLVINESRCGNTIKLYSIGRNTTEFCFPWGKVK